MWFIYIEIIKNVLFIQMYFINRWISEFTNYFALIPQVDLLDYRIIVAKIIYYIKWR